MFEHTMCSSNLQGTQVKETAKLQFSLIRPILLAIVWYDD